MDVEAEFKRSGRILRSRIERDVAVAMDRIWRYTPTELREVDLGLRESESARDERLAQERIAAAGRQVRDAAEAVGRNFRAIHDSLTQLVEGIARGFRGGAA